MSFDLPTFLLVLRYALTLAGGYLVAHGVANDAQVQQVAGAIIGIAPVIFGWISHKQQTAAVITAAATGAPVQATIASPITSPHA